MEAGLKTIVDDGLTINELKKKEAMTSLRWDITAIMGMDTSDLWDELIQTLENILQNTQSRIRPIVRAPLMATSCSDARWTSETADPENMDWHQVELWYVQMFPQERHDV
jgi:hypothetical protein